MQAKVEKKAGKKNKTLQHMWKDRVLYLMLAPTLIYFLIFRVWPIINMRLAFCNYRAKGPWEFAGLKYFDMIFKSSTFMEILRNTLIISFMKYILLFPFFVIFALLLNEIRCGKFRKYVQIISYMPHFLSWVVIAGIWISMLSVSGGAVNQIMGWFGLDAVDFMTNKGTIRWVLFFSEGWRSLGWDSIGRREADRHHPVYHPSRPCRTDDNHVYSESGLLYDSRIRPGLQLYKPVRQQCNRHSGYIRLPYRT